MRKGQLTAKTLTAEINMFPVPLNEKVTVSASALRDLGNCDLLQAAPVEGVHRDGRVQRHLEKHGERV